MWERKELAMSKEEPVPELLVIIQSWISAP
jgi:hypothetical protein